MAMGDGEDYDSHTKYWLTRMDSGSINRLTERQKDCLRLVAQGYTSKEIGRALDLSPSTVDNHILAAVQAINASSRGEAARFLANEETRQKIPREPEPLAEPQFSALKSIPAKAPALSIFGRKIWTLPPLGGFRNALNASERTLRIVQVAAVGFGTMMGLTLLIAGALRIFS
jgi:DNA-binding CsgD family transcriptional regulator